MLYPIRLFQKVHGPDGFRKFRWSIKSYTSRSISAKPLNMTRANYSFFTIFSCLALLAVARAHQCTFQPFGVYCPPMPFVIVTFKNNCGSSVKPVIANVNCGYSPRCNTPGSGGVVGFASRLNVNPCPQYHIQPNPAVSYTGPQPNTLAPGASQTLTVNQFASTFSSCTPARVLTVRL